MGCFRVDPGRDPRELAERRVKAGEAGGKTPERRSSGLGGRQGDGGLADTGWG